VTSDEPEKQKQEARSQKSGARTQTRQYGKPDGKNFEERSEDVVENKGSANGN
jgi:hypothetical protein